MNRYLLEIGVEELPARFVKTTLAQMEKYVSEKLNEKRIPFDEMKFYSTPRRLVLLIEGLPERQEDLEKEVKGLQRK